MKILWKFEEVETSGFCGKLNILLINEDFMLKKKVWKNDGHRSLSVGWKNEDKEKTGKTIFWKKLEFGKNWKNLENFIF